jgi:AraC-like DNA-binding protein
MAKRSSDISGKPGSHPDKNFIRKSSNNSNENGTRIAYIKEIMLKYKEIISKEYNDPELNIEVIAERIGCSLEDLNKACKYEFGVTANYHFNTFKFIEGVKIIFNDGELIGKMIGYYDSREFYNALKSRIGMCKCDLMSLINKYDGEFRIKLYDDILNLLTTKDRTKKNKMINELKSKVEAIKL